MTKCRKCKAMKPASEFRSETNFGARGYWCESCRYADHSKRRGYQYGISTDQLREYMRLHGDKCAICEAGRRSNLPYYALQIDHDHKTGEVRGILCRSCNTILGLVSDEVPRLLKLIKYVQAGGYHKVPPKNRDCKNCGASINDRAANAKHCSVKCQRSYRARQYMQRKLGRVIMPRHRKR